jgi:glycerol-3-phosphate acyltransferase PlsY
VDIRQVGEGNAGARNVYHVVGRWWGTLVALLDMGKGLLALLVGRWLGAAEWAVLISGFAVVLGHGYPFLRWKQGGKGVAAAMGFLLGLLPFSTLIGFAAGGIAWALLRDVNQVLVVACVGIVLAPLAFGEPWTTPAYVIALMLTMGSKKIVDLAHERNTWQESGWTDGATPGFHGQGGETRQETLESRQA